MSRLLNRTERLAEIERMLFRSAGGMTAIEIADAAGVDRRTVYRDLDLLSTMGIPLWQEDGKYGITRDQYLATVRLTLNEAISLFIAARLLSGHADHQNPHIVAALTKLGMAFPAPLSAHIALTADAVSHYPLDRDFVAVFEAITTAWAEGRKVRIWYASRSNLNEVKPREFAPYFIEPTPQGGLYAIGYDGQRRQIRTFKLQRIRKAQLLDERYTIPDDFNAEEYFSTAWGIMGGRGKVKVVLVFTADAAALLKEHRWHASQELTDLPDGACRLTLWVKDWIEMQPWIKSWGSVVTVHEPAELREALAEDARRVAALYTHSS
jgi:proteasome accessory factor B